MALLDYHKTEISALNALIQLGYNGVSTTGLTDVELRATPVEVSVSFPAPITTIASSSDQAHSHYRNTALSNTPVTVKASPGNIYGYKFINVNTVPVYIKMYNIVSGSVIVGTSTISKVFAIPASDGTNPGMLEITPDISALFYASIAISIAAVTELADINSTAPTTAIYTEVTYK